jgi:predicted DNA-binding WGR domain protein
MRRFERVEGKSRKFWEVEVAGSSLAVRFGRIGGKGQTQTKPFAGPAAAEKERDKLVGEKTRKGYVEVGGGSPPPPPDRPPSAAAPILRADWYVYNEATGFSFTHEGLGGRGIDGGGKAWMAAVKRGDIIPIELVQDDPFNVRIVVSGELEPAEAEEWVGRFDAKLRVPDGRFVVGGGSEYVMEAFDEEPEYMREYVRHIAIPPGEYRASVYTYMGSVNGRACLQAARGGDEPDPLGEWFRRTRPGEAFPPWLHNDCVIDPAEDPGHETEWKKAKKVDDPNDYIDFLIHLTPLARNERLDMPEPGGDGWFSYVTESRVPERIPLGIVARDLQGRPVEAEAAPEVVAVSAKTAGFARLPIAGGAVEVPLGRLDRLYRLAWFCHVWSMPAIRVRPARGRRLPTITAVADTQVETEGDAVVVRFVVTGRQSGALRALAALSPQLEALEDDTVVEIDALYDDADELAKERPIGLHRYLGVVSGGKLQLTEAFPVPDANALASALALSAQVERGPLIEAGSKELADRVFAALESHPFFADNPPVKRETAIGQKKLEPIMLNVIAAEIFKLRDEGFWPCFVLEEEEEEEEDEAEAGGPPRGERILQGKGRWFHSSDAARVDAEAARRIRAIEKELRPLGFTFVADVLCSDMPHGVIRGYAQDGGSIWGAALVGPHGRGSFEFVERLGENGSLTTTTNEIVRDEVYRDAYKTVCAKSKIAEMWKKHRRRSAYLAESLGAPRALDRSAKGLAADVEASLVREEKRLPTRPVLLRTPERVHCSADSRLLHPDAPGIIDAADAAAVALGFRPIDGDVASSFFTSYVHRGYVHENGDTWGIHMLDASTVDPPAGQWIFITRYAKGAILETAKAALSKDEPKRKIFRVLDPNAPPKAMFAKHERRKPELTSKWGDPAPVKARDSKALAAEVEAFFERLVG